MFLKRFLGFSLGISLFILTGCESIGDFQAPVVEGFSKSSSTRVGKKKSGDYRVKRGDTLYSIAWANDLDYRTLAEINQLEAPYKIYAGQYLKTHVGFFHSLGLMFKKGKPVSHQTRMVKKEPLKRAPIRSRVSREETQYEVIKAKKTSAPRPHYAASSPVMPAAYPKKSTPVKGWRWPANGKVVQGFSDRAGGNKGIDLTGPYGAPVLAAATGKVVYSGSGLKGYGQLLLVKHNNSFLSAYAHNKRLLVREGDEVTAGQKIAEMGRANHGMVRLHFEIRHNGQPVNPMIYLASARR